MDAITIALILVVATCILLIFLSQLKNQFSGLPDGPYGVPILGSYFNLGPRVFLAFFELRKKYGSVVLINVGFPRYIILTSYKSIREALIEKADNFSGRLNDKFSQKMTRKSGILTVDGPLWQEHRRFSLHTLRDFGFGRSTSGDIITHEWENLSQHLDRHVNTPVNTIDLLLRTVSNVICTMTFAEQPGYDPNDEFGDIVHKIRENIRSPFFKILPVMFPQLSVLFPIMKYMPSMKWRINNLDDSHNYIISKIEEHKRTLDPEGEPRDFTDVYLQQQLKLANEKNTFTDWQLIRVIFELFIAGTDTTSNSLAWGIFWLAIKPDIQAKVHEEIDEKIDRSRPITYKDRSSLHMVQAVLDEVQRWASIVPNSLPHRNFKADTIQGYTIPANSRIIPCIYAAHHDPEVWKKPEEFYPDHFLNEKGEYRSREELIPFSIGRRSCLGESLARMELFVFFTSIIRRYSVSLDPASQKNMESILLGTDGTIRSPGDHKIIFKIRE